jgi:hypothetical protein
MANVVIHAAGEDAPGQGAGHRRRGPAQQDGGDQGPQPLLLQQRQSCPHLGLPQRQFGPVEQGDRNQVVHGLVELDQLHPQFRRLQRHHLGRGVEPQDSLQVGAGHLPALAGEQLGLLPPRQLRLGPVGFQGLHQARADQTPDAPGNLLHAAPRLNRPGQFAAGLLDGEVGIGHRQQGVVGRGLQVRPAGAELLPGGQPAENGIVEVQDGGRAYAGPRTEHQTAVAGVDDVARHVLDPAVVAVVIAAHGDGGQPGRVGLLQHGRRRPDALRGRGDVDRPGVGQSQRGRQIDGQGALGGGGGWLPRARLRRLTYLLGVRRHRLLANTTLHRRVSGNDRQEACKDRDGPPAGAAASRPSSSARVHRGHLVLTPGRIARDNPARVLVS